MNRVADCKSISELAESNKSWKPIDEDFSLFTTTMRAFTHRLKQRNFWVIKTSIWWVNRHIVQTWHEWFLFISVCKKNKPRSERFSTPEK